MSLTRTAIEKNRITVVLVLVLLLTGVRAYQGMPQAEDPGFTIRTALVLTTFPGASPERVEQLVTDKLEKAIQEMPEIDTINSQSKTGVSIITVDIQERFTDMRPIWDSLRRKVQRVTPDLPSGIIGPDVNDEFGDVFGTIVTVTGDGYSAAELEDVADDVRDELLLIDDVAKVGIHGTQEERIFVEYSNARLAELGLSPGQLRNVLASRNIINPGGEVRTPDEVIVLEPSGNFESVDDVRSTLVALPNNGELVRLEDVATVRRGYVEPRSVSMHANGEPGLALAIAMREGGNIVDLGVEVRATVDRVQATYPIGLELGYVQFQADEVAKKVDGFIGNLVQAVGIVLLVMLVSLGLRTGLVVASLIPTAIIMAFIFMPLWDVGIDQMSLAALIIALGLLVDNAIVVSESILVKMAEGVPKVEAAVASAEELKIPLLTSSLTTAAAFLPIYLAESAVGEYTGALFKVVTITLLCSWVLALTLIPLLCVVFLRVEPAKDEGFDSRWYRSYRGLLLLALRNRLIAIGLVIAAFVGSLWLFQFVPNVFFPSNDRATLTAELILPVGTPFSGTESVVKEVERFLRDELEVGALPTPKRPSLLQTVLPFLDRTPAPPSGVTTWATFLGEGAPRFYLSYGPEQASSNYAIMIINTTTRAATDEVITRLRAFCAEGFPGLKARIEPLSSGTGVTTPIQVRISGREADEVFSLVEQVKTQLATMQGPRNVSDDWGARSKKLVVEIDESRAQRAGVTHEEIAVSLQTVFSGITATEYREGDKVVPVTLRSTQARRNDLESFTSVNVFSGTTGRSVPVGQVADVDMVWQPSKILRRNRLKTVTVEADLDPGVTAAEVTALLGPWLEEQEWPLGYSWELGGEDEASAEANASIGAQLPVAGLVIVLLLVTQFNSLRRPAIILLTIPLGLIGVIIGLLVLRSYFGFMTLLGVVSLAGIVINNAIVLLDRIRVEIEDNGRTPQAAIIESAQRRLRPILLTTFTTLGGMIPLYLGGGPMFEPMAVAIMFGLVFATVLTLGFVPVLYALFFRVSYRDVRGGSVG